MQHLDVIALAAASLGVLAYGISRLVSAVNDWRLSAYQRACVRGSRREYARELRRAARLRKRHPNLL